MDELQEYMKLFRFMEYQTDQFVKELVHLMKQADDKYKNIPEDMKWAIRKPDYFVSRISNRLHAKRNRFNEDMVAP